LGGAEASRLNRGIEVMTARAGLRIAIIIGLVLSDADVSMRMTWENDDDV
jgi:hypothetical protein